MSDVAVSLTPPPVITATVNPSEIAVSVAAAPAVAVTIGPVAGAHNGLAGIQGGALNDYYHLPVAKYNALGLHESLIDLLGGLASEHYHLNAAEYAARGLHNSLSDLQGGAIGERYHLTAADYAARLLGSGTPGYVPYFTGAQALGNSPIFVNGPNVGIGTATPRALFDLAGDSGILVRWWDVTNKSVTCPFVTYSASNLNVVGFLDQIQGAHGGLMFAGMSDIASCEGLMFAGYIGSATPTATPVVFRGGKLGAAGARATVAATEKLFQFRNFTTDLITVLGNGNFGIGTASPAGGLHVAFPAYASTALFERTGQTDNSARVTFRVKSTKATDMGVGFGSGMIFCIQDNAGVENGIVELNATRGSTDLEGDLQLRLYNALGVGYDRLVIKGITGNVGLSIAAPTAKLHLPASAAAANSASMKIDAGVVASVSVAGNIESDGTHLYWTDAGGTRRQLDN